MSDENSKPASVAPVNASAAAGTGREPTPAPDVTEAPTTPASGEAPAATATATDEDRGASGERVDRGIADFVRRAVSAGVVAASRSKDDIVRVAATEMRGWLDHLNLDEEIAKALTKMVIEVKTEVRFRSTEDGKLVPEATNDVKVKGPR
ncbi:MAG: hypothetical protein H7X95_05200 [Deltaproteobacteria bacterium]|nr:hypothetical protein [Deltaproteobacteria bacterium]